MSRAEVLMSFQKDTADHAMTVLSDDGLYRHLRFRKPGCWAYGFDIVTWPGHLAITGDMGSSVFARLPDMLNFFRGKPDGEFEISPGYWAEKLQANDGNRLEYKASLFRELVKERFDEFVAEHHEEDEPAPPWAAELWETLESEVLSPEEDWDSLGRAIEAMGNFAPDKDAPYAGFGFHDAGECSRSLQDYTFHFIWRCYAIAFAVRLYDQHKAAQAELAG